MEVLSVLLKPLQHPAAFTNQQYTIIDIKHCCFSKGGIKGKSTTVLISSAAHLYHSTHANIPRLPQLSSCIISSNCVL